MAPDPRQQSLLALLEPRSVAVIGASATPGKQGNTAIVYLKRAGFQGPIYPINPAGGEIEGLAVYRSITDVPETVDCVFTLVPAAATSSVIAECAASGVRSVVIGASGFAELGTDAGRRLQDEIAAIARAAGMRILGPNTNGIWNATHRLALGFNTSHGDPMTPGAISVAAHSGALFDSFAPRLAAFGGGYSKLIPLGNEADIDMLDALEFLIEDPATNVIGLIMEAIANGTRLRALAARAHAARKPIVVLKLARSAAGVSAALAHSSRMAGRARAYAALLAACGIPVVRSIETLAAVCTLLSDPRAIPHDDDSSLDRRLIGVSSSGGGCSLMADHAADVGVALAGAPDGAWTGETAALIATYSDTGLIRNPIDGGNLRGWGKLPDLIAAMERDGLMGPMVGFAHRLPSLAADMSLFTPLKDRKARGSAPVVVVAPGGLRPQMQARYAAERIPVFHDLPTCFESLRCLYDLMGFAHARARSADATATATAVAVELEPAALAEIRALLARARDETRGTAGARPFLSETESAALLRAAGVPMVQSHPVMTLPATKAIARAIGYPVVLKALAPGIAHKDAAGLVAVGLATETELADAFARLQSALAGLGQSAADAAIILQPMIGASAELIIGTTWEPGLGHFLVAGLGGVDTELLDTVELYAVPTSPGDLKALVSASRCGALLARLGARFERDLIADTVEALSALQALVLACPDDIHAIDVNPLLVGANGCLAVDALVVPANQTPARGGEGPLNS